MADQDTSHPQSQEQAWGQALQTALSTHDAIKPCNLAQQAMRAVGLAPDPSNLINAINQANGNHRDSFCDIIACLDTALQQLNNQLSETKYQLIQTEQQLHIAQADVVSQRELANEYRVNMTNMSKALAPRVEGGSIRRFTKDPDAFSGDEKSLFKRQTEYQSFRDKVNGCHIRDSNIFDSEFRKIFHLWNLLSGSAATVFRPKFTSFLAHPDDPEMWEWKTIQEVWIALNAVYEPLDLA